MKIENGVKEYEAGDVVSVGANKDVYTLIEPRDSCDNFEDWWVEYKHGGELLISRNVKTDKWFFVEF